MKEKNDEIKALQQRVFELQKVTKNSIENEVKRLGSLLSEADERIKEKDNEILELKNLNDTDDQKGILYSQALEAENAELKQKLESVELKYKDAMETVKVMKKEMTKKTKEENAADPGVDKKMRKELSAAYKDIVNLSKAISGILKGDEPNMQSLWGVAHTEKGGAEGEELGLEDLGNLKMAIDTIRTNICDYYAEKYSNECNLQ